MSRWYGSRGTGPLIDPENLDITAIQQFKRTPPRLGCSEWVQTVHGPCMHPNDETAFREVLHLYRPRLPGQRAQAIQVLHTCHALAQRGHEVTVLRPGLCPCNTRQALQQLGLTVDGGLDIRIAPLNHSGIAGLWFRRELAKWWSGPKGVVLARDKRRLAHALRSHGRTHRILRETHELDSALVKDRGENPQPLFDLEAWLATQAHAMVTNCGGTLRPGKNHSPSFSPNHCPQRFVTHESDQSETSIR